MYIGRRDALAAMTSLACAGLSTRLFAQGLSDRPITIIVPFTPGTGIDILGRLVGENIRQRWNQPRRTAIR
jgi:tripartite-type tricarboxylate transporter receptor subunit TctC